MKYILLAALGAVSLLAQDYEGADIRNAIPIEFGQQIKDTLDPSLRPRLVYAVILARGQRFTVTARRRSGSGQIWLGVFDPRLTTLSSGPQALATTGWQVTAGSIEYAVPAEGRFYIGISSRLGNLEFDLAVSAVGARLDVPLPAIASCLEGLVDEIQFNLQQVSMNLAEELVVGGVRICASCNVKPTLFPAFVDFLKQSHFAGTRVQVCHSDDGQIVRVKSAR